MNRMVEIDLSAAELFLSYMDADEFVERYDGLLDVYR